MLLPPASGAAAAASERAGGLEGAVQETARQHAGEGGRGGERGVMRKKGKFHWCSLTVFIVSVLPSLQHDFEAALAAKDAIIEQLRRDLQEMQAKLDVSEGVGVDVSEGVGVGVSVREDGCTV